MRELALRILSWCLLALLVACEQEDPQTLTQVTVRVTAEEALRSTMTELRVRAALRLPDGTWRRPVQNRFPAAKLLWPVDVPVAPRNSVEASAQFEVVAEALQGDVVLAEARAITWFSPNRFAMLDLRLFACPGKEPGFVCTPDCQGADCDVCNAEGACERVKPIEPGALPSMPAPGASVDATVGAVMAGEGDGGVTQPAPGTDAANVTVSPMGVDAGGQMTVTSDGGMSMVEAGLVVVTDAGPRPECDAMNMCSAGYNCVQGSCVSACMQTRCDPNATCSLMAGAPVCACNSGFIAMTGSGGAVTCLRDVACEDLGCDVNASCIVGANQVRSCACKTGYMGSGTSCAPVSCPAPAVENGTVTGGMTYNQMATYRCNTGFRQGTGTWTRTCGSNMQWSGTQPRCDAITCTPAPTNPTNGSVSLSQGTMYGSVATYACNQGYRLQGGASRTCGDLGWSGSAPTCALMCGNGQLDTGEQCDPGTSNGAWTCTSTCTPKSAYTACSGGCLNGETCTAWGCSASCSTVNSCPLPPEGSTLTRSCNNSSRCILNGCSSNSQCPPGLICLVVDGASICSACFVGSSPSQCPAGQSCVSPNGTTIGFCR